MKFLLAVLVLVAGVWAQDTYKCPDGWMLEVGLEILLTYFFIIAISRRTGVGADALC